MIGLKPESETEYLMIVDYLIWYKTRNDKIKEITRYEYLGFSFGDLFKHKYGRDIDEFHAERSALIVHIPKEQSRFGREKIIS